MEYIVHVSKNQNDSKLKLTLERFAWNDPSQHIDTLHRFKQIAPKLVLIYYHLVFHLFALQITL